MLDGEDDAIVAVAAQVQVGIAPGVEFGRSARACPAWIAPAPFQAWWTTATAWRRCGSQEGEQWRGIATDILIDAMQADERIEDRQARLQSGDGLAERASGSLTYRSPGGRRGGNLAG